jgi:hypothetical protein
MVWQEGFRSLITLIALSSAGRLMTLDATCSSRHASRLTWEGVWSAMQSLDSVPCPVPGTFYLQTPGGELVDCSGKRVRRAVSVEEIRQARKMNSAALGDHIKVSSNGEDWCPIAQVARLDRSIAYDVFISSASEDYGVAEEIRRRLCLDKIDAYLAPKTMRAESDFVENIAESLKRSLVIVYIASGTSYSKAWVKRELIIALEGRKPIVAFRIDNDPVSDGFKLLLSLHNWIETGGNWRDRLDTLVEFLQKPLDMRLPRQRPWLRRLTSWLQRLRLAIFGMGNSVGKVAVTSVLAAALFVGLGFLAMRSLAPPAYEAGLLEFGPNEKKCLGWLLDSSDHQASKEQTYASSDLPTQVSTILRIVDKKSVPAIAGDFAEKWRIKPENVAAVLTLARASDQSTDQYILSSARVLREVAEKVLAGKGLKDEWLIVYLNRDDLLIVSPLDPAVAGGDEDAEKLYCHHWRVDELKGSSPKMPNKDRIPNRSIYWSSKILICGEVPAFLAQVVASKDPLLDSSVLNLGKPTSKQELSKLLADHLSLDSKGKADLKILQEAIQGLKAGDPQSHLLYHDLAAGDAENLANACSVLGDLLLNQLGVDGGREILVLPFIH